MTTNMHTNAATQGNSFQRIDAQLRAQRRNRFRQLVAAVFCGLSMLLVAASVLQFLI